MFTPKNNENTCNKNCIINIIYEPNKIIDLNT